MWTFVRTASVGNHGTRNWCAQVVLARDGVEEAHFLDLGQAVPDVGALDALGVALAARLTAAAAEAGAP